MTNYNVSRSKLIDIIIVLASVSISLLLSQSSFASNNIKQLNENTELNIANSTIDDSASPTPSQIDTSKFPTLRTRDWRSESNLPWSEPVVVVDEFEGNYLAVFDKNFNDNFWTDEKSGIVSNWSRKHLRIYSYYSAPCRGLFCQRKYVVNQASNVSIKIRDEVFRLEGKAGNFNLPEALTYALKTSPPERTRIKIMFEDNGREVISDIGEGTVKAWKTVYYDAIEPKL
jgi:hypothetical protein